MERDEEEADTADQDHFGLHGGGAAPSKCKARARDSGREAEALASNHDAEGEKGSWRLSRVEVTPPAKMPEVPTRSFSRLHLHHLDGLKQPRLSDHSLFDYGGTARQPPRV